MGRKRQERELVLFTSTMSKILTHILRITTAVWRVWLVCIVVSVRVIAKPTNKLKTTFSKLHEMYQLI